MISTRMTSEVTFKRPPHAGHPHPFDARPHSAVLNDMILRERSQDRSK